MKGKFQISTEAGYHIYTSQWPVINVKAIYSKFHRNPLTGFGATGGRNLPFPITLAIGF